ncbi:MAG: hypothetical protein Q9203_006761, partial [Teloschistes exilis]
PGPQNEGDDEEDDEDLYGLAPTTARVHFRFRPFAFAVARASAFAAAAARAAAGNTTSAAQAATTSSQAGVTGVVCAVVRQRRLVFSPTHGGEKKTRLYE